METLSVEIINPDAKELLLNLEKLSLIKIFKNGAVAKVDSDIEAAKKEFSKLLEKFRSHGEEPLTLEEITAEVEIVRQEMYEEKLASK